MTRKQTNGAVAATLPLIGIPAKRGRPASGKALSNSERQRRWRKSHKTIEAGDQISATIKRLADQFDLSDAQVTRELLRFALCNRNWAQTGFPLSVTKKEISQ